ncbi:MAG: hypothetical protein ACP5OG_05685 [Candidatus Nanoarchaeia archaeon]
MNKLHISKKKLVNSFLILAVVTLLIAFYFILINYGSVITGYAGYAANKPGEFSNGEEEGQIPSDFQNNDLIEEPIFNMQGQYDETSEILNNSSTNSSSNSSANNKSSSGNNRGRGGGGGGSQGNGNPNPNENNFTNPENNNTVSEPNNQTNTTSPSNSNNQTNPENNNTTSEPNNQTNQETNNQTNTTSPSNQDNETNPENNNGNFPEDKTKKSLFKNIKQGLSIWGEDSEIGNREILNGRYKLNIRKNNKVISEFDFEVNGDVDFSDIDADSDEENGKAFMHSNKKISNFSMYVARAEEQNSVIVCLNASRLEQIHPGCLNEPGVTGEYMLKVGDRNLEISKDKKYFIVKDLHGTGVMSYIYISNAIHLDSNKEFISDIYEQVREKDNIWSEPIENNEYVRVTFEKNLTRKNDITIYARAASLSRIEVYKQNGNEIIAEFDNIIGEGWHKVYLDGLTGTSSIFDLKVFGEIEFDYIVDPALVGPNGASYTNISEGRALADNATARTAFAGNTSEIAIFGYSTTQSWQGFYGNISGVIKLADSNNNVFYNWSAIDPKGQIYATRTNSVDFSSIKCANSSEMLSEDYFIGAANMSDSVNNTFNKNNHPRVYIASKLIESNSCNSTNIYDEGGVQDINFYEILLSDDFSNIVYTSIIEQDVLGFDARHHDFEMIVGENGRGTDTSTTLYYFYAEIS